MSVGWSLWHWHLTWATPQLSLLKFPIDWRYLPASIHQNCTVWWLPWIHQWSTGILFTCSIIRDVHLCKNKNVRKSKRGNCVRGLQLDENLIQPVKKGIIRLFGHICRMRDDRNITILASVRRSSYTTVDMRVGLNAATVAYCWTNEKSQRKTE